MDDDLNTADAITAVFELITQIHTVLKTEGSKPFAKDGLALLQELCDVLGLLQDAEEVSWDEEIQSLVQQRQEARANKDFQRADEIRDLLKERGIVLKDTPQGVQIMKDEPYEYHGIGLYWRCGL
jgi:cysteinyl-tRNA synthetase